MKKMRFLNPASFTYDNVHQIVAPGDVRECDDDDAEFFEQTGQAVPEEESEDNEVQTTIKPITDTIPRKPRGGNRLPQNRRSGGGGAGNSRPPNKRGNNKS